MAEVLSASPTTHEILLSHGERNDGTNYPIWAIVVKAGLGRYAWEAGPWFSREEAKAHLDSHAYRYSKKAFVYCFSGHMSYHLRQMYENARKEAQQKPPQSARRLRMDFKALHDRPDLVELLMKENIYRWIGGENEEEKES